MWEPRAQDEKIANLQAENQALQAKIATLQLEITALQAKLKIQRLDEEEQAKERDANVGRPVSPRNPAAFTSQMNKGCDKPPLLREDTPHPNSGFQLDRKTTL